MSTRGQGKLARNLSVKLRYVAALVPALGLLSAAVLINESMFRAQRTQVVAEQARLVAESVGLRLGELLKLTAFCASSPALIDRVDLQSVVENCGRYAATLGAWVVIVETGETHRQILNTRPDAPVTLPSYPRSEEVPALLDLEEKSRQSGEPGIANVFTGRVYPNGVVSTGQHLRLADGRDSMLYVGLPAPTFSEQLTALSEEGGPVLGLVDASRRIVARSVGIEQVMFSPVPDWLHAAMDSGMDSIVLGVPAAEEIGGIWDGAIQPLSVAPGWIATALKPAPVGLRFWTVTSLPAGLLLIGLLISGILTWGISTAERVSQRAAAAERAREEAATRERERSRLLASFAHDIRSPLISLIGSLELVEEEQSGAAPKVRMTRRAAEALLQMVDDILELAFLGSGALSFHPSPVDLQQLAIDLLEQSQGKATRKGLILHLDIDPLLTDMVMVDRLRLQQVLSNLLTNALKYTERGSVTLRMRSQKEHDGSLTCEFAVVDTGVGLAKEQIPRILREFGRLDREVERREPGTGLGLAIVQRILDGMKTKLHVDSKPGEGSVFGFRLRLPIAGDQTNEDPALPLSGVLILYAEDEPVIRRVTARSLEEAGARVISAVDGEDALRLLAAMSPDLLLVDLQMPVLDGVGMIRRIEEIWPEHSFPIFVLTSHISGPQAAEARAGGAVTVLTKPVQVSALAAAFRARRGYPLQSDDGTRDHTEDAGGRLIDMATFVDATDHMNKTYALELVLDFENSVQTAVTELEVASSGGDVLEVRKLAHRSLGLCQVMGAVRLAQCLRLIENDALAGDLATVRKLLGDCRRILDMTLKEMRSKIE